MYHTEGAENSIPVHVYIAHTGGRGSELSFEAIPQEYL
jgi:hypothetical protein